MRIPRKTSKSALPLLCSTIFMVGSANAGGTDAGKSVENTFTLDYEVSSVPQGTITNDPDYTPDAGDPSPVINPAGPTNFTVDRMIDLSVTANNSNLIVPSNAQDRILEFSVTNLGNDYHAYSFSIADVAGDDFDATDLQLTYSRAAYDLNGDGDTSDACEGEVVDAALTATVVGSSAGSASYTCDIPADLPFTVKISGDIPTELTEQDVDNLILVAETRNPSQWVFEGIAPSVGGVTAKDSDSANTIEGTAENVFADGTGSSEEANEDGLMSAASSYIVTSPDLTAEKRVWVLETDSDTSGCNAQAIPSSEPTSEYPTPGACVLYTIEVRNTGEVAGSNADNLDIIDVLPSDIAFVSATTNGFSTPGTLTYKKADGTTDCDGSAGEDCTVSLIATSLDAQVGATDTVAQLYIRALVR